MPDNLEDQKMQDYIDAIINAKLNTEIPKLLNQSVLFEARISELEDKVATMSEQLNVLGGSTGGSTTCCDELTERVNSFDFMLEELSETVSSHSNSISDIDTRLQNLEGNMN
jgi:uncharacterized coiled-coil protein SlyX